MTRWEWIDLVLSADGPARPTVRFVVWTLMAHYYNDSKGCAWPSVETLAGRTAYSVRTVQGALEEAEASGWLRRAERAGDTSEYRPVLLGEVLRFTPAKSAGVTPAESAPLPRRICGGPPQNLHPSPAESAPEERRKEGERERRKEGAPSCPACSADMELKPASKRSAAFWGCSRFAGKGRGGCKGKLELDDPRLGALAIPRALNDHTRQPAHGAAAIARSVSEVSAGLKAKSIERETRAKIGEAWIGQFGGSRLVVRFTTEAVVWRAEGDGPEVSTGLVAWRLWERGARLSVGHGAESPAEAS